MKTLASAVKTFETQKSEEIGFCFGDTLKIDVPNQIDQWCKAELQTVSSGSKTGWVPRSHLKIMPAYWYSSSRNEAEASLRELKFQNGSFLVRESRTPRDYSLTVKLSSNRIEHYKVIREKKSSPNRRYQIWGSASFSSLYELIEYYSKNSILNPQVTPSGQSLCLREPISDHTLIWSKFTGVAKHRFCVEEENEIELNIGDQVEIHTHYKAKYNLDNQWWFGRNLTSANDQMGLFPSNFIFIPRDIRQKFNITVKTAD